VSKSVDEELGPTVVFADPEQTIYLADMSGDGLNDLVRIRNGNVCYWPSLGFTRFGSKVTMDNTPWFDYGDQFSNSRIRLADIDGSGMTDILYIGSQGVGVYRNESGNSWAPMVRLENFLIDNMSSAVVNDLLGTDTACLVWSSVLPGDAQRQMRYIDLMGGSKPHLLTKMTNSMGTETRVHYTPSTHFYLQDKQNGKPWLTRLPFPVHVMELVETFDRVSRNHFATRYAYHHGYFDGVEREFRGFGMVEQWNAEEFAALLPLGNEPPLNLDEASHVPLVLTKTWFHTVFSQFDGDISKQFESDYYREPGITDDQLRSMTLEDTVLPTQVRLPDGTLSSYVLSPQEIREASRSLKGSILRQEIYGLDGTEKQPRPYNVSERNFTIEFLQPLGPINRHAVFYSHPRETVNINYERTLVIDAGGNPMADPMVTHQMVLDVDDFGNILKSVAVGYGRRRDAADPLLTPEDHAKQKATLITYVETRYTNAVLEDDNYLGPLPYESLTYELLKAVREDSDP